jgi:TPR repeat protein
MFRALFFVLSALLLIVIAHAENEEADDDSKSEAAQRAAFVEIRRKAEAGEARSMLELGMAYLVGMGTEINRSAGVSWTLKAAEKGDALAQFSYGHICRRGELRPKDHAEALRWYRRSAAQGNADAELAIAQAYEAGLGTAVDEAESVRWLRLSATHGHPIAQQLYAVEIFTSKEADLARECVVWLEKSALQGNPTSMALLATRLLHGDGVSRDKVQALAWAMLADACGDDDLKMRVGEFISECEESERKQARKAVRSLTARMNVAPMFAEGGRLMKAAKEFERQFALAQEGNADEQYRLSVSYARGRGTVKDMSEAAVWCRRAAEQGHLDAMRTLAVCHENGLGVPMDSAEMVKWYRKAAEKGDAQSQFKLGAFHADGEVVEKDMEKAEYWTRKAADQGHKIAQSNMGTFIVVRRDQNRGAEAFNWFKLSAQQGHPAGMYKYGFMIFNGFEVQANRIEGSAWIVASLDKADDRLKKLAEETLSKLTDEERKKAEEVAEEIKKTF